MQINTANRQRRCTYSSYGATHNNYIKKTTDINREPIMKVWIVVEMGGEGYLRAFSDLNVAKEVEKSNEGCMMPNETVCDIRAMYNRPTTEQCAFEVAGDVRLRPVHVVIGGDRGCINTVPVVTSDLAKAEHYKKAMNDGDTSGLYYEIVQIIVDEPQKKNSEEKE
jgi:hypothetical protein